MQQALGKGGWVVITLIQVAALSGRARRLLPGGGGQPAGQFAAKPAKPRVCPPPFWRGGALAHARSVGTFRDYNHVGVVVGMRPGNRVVPEHRS